jgi:hypothetical protein
VRLRDGITVFVGVGTMSPMTSTSDELLDGGVAAVAAGDERHAGSGLTSAEDEQTFFDESCHLNRSDGHLSCQGSSLQA